MIRAQPQVSPQLYARAIGVLYLTVIVVGFFAYGYVPGKLVAANAAVTANDILAHEFLWRAGVVDVPKWHLWSAQPAGHPA